MVRRKKNIGFLDKDKEVGRMTVKPNQSRRRRSNAKPFKFSNYVYKVLKQVHPMLSMTNKAMKVMDDFMLDIFSRLVDEAAGLVKRTKRSTLSASEFQTATRLILPGELAKHAINEASKAVANFMTSKTDDAKRSLARRVIDKITSPSAPGVENNQQPVEIEIFGTGSRSLLNNSRQPDIVESVSIEEDELAKDTPRQVLFPTRDKSPVLSEGSRTERVLAVDMSLDSTPISNRGRDSETILIHTDMVEDDLTDEEEGSLTALEELGPPTPSSKANSSITSPPPEQAVDLINEPRDEENDISDDEEEIAAMNLEDEDIEPSTSGCNKEISVEVTRQENPEIISNDSSSGNISRSVNAELSSSLHTSTRIIRDPNETTCKVTVRCSKITTTKNISIQEQEKQNAEDWLSDDS